MGPVFGDRLATDRDQQQRESGCHRPPRMRRVETVARSYKPLVRMRRAGTVARPYESLVSRHELRSPGSMKK